MGKTFSNLAENTSVVGYLWGKSEDKKDAKAAANEAAAAKAAEATRVQAATDAKTAEDKKIGIVNLMASGPGGVLGAAKTGKAKLLGN
jgi:hypothetical protein